MGNVTHPKNTGRTNKTWQSQILAMKSEMNLLLVTIMQEQVETTCTVEVLAAQISEHDLQETSLYKQEGKGKVK